MRRWTGASDTTQRAVLWADATTTILGGSPNLVVPLYLGKGKPCSGPSTLEGLTLCLPGWEELSFQREETSESRGHQTPCPALFQTTLQGQRHRSLAFPILLDEACLQGPNGPFSWAHPLWAAQIPRAKRWPRGGSYLQKGAGKSGRELGCGPECLSVGTHSSSLWTGAERKRGWGRCQSGA